MPFPYLVRHHCLPRASVMDGPPLRHPHAHPGLLICELRVRSSGEPTAPASAAVVILSMPIIIVAPPISIFTQRSVPPPPTSIPFPI